MSSPTDPAEGWAPLSTTTPTSTRPAVVQLVTVVDIDDQLDQGLHASEMQVSARHEAELDNGRRVLLLDDRGWGGSGPPNIWATESLEILEEEARAVVGPDEPDERLGETAEVMAAYHYGMLDGILRQQGVEAGNLQRLPHRVEFTERVHARLERAKRAE
ncbi:MAG TPA: hypothetical protein VK086_04005 [Ruania sp.]|nr:hypothetical protein [Ruania sp.]